MPNRRIARHSKAEAAGKTAQLALEAARKASAKALIARGATEGAESGESVLKELIRMIPNYFIRASPRRTGKRPVLLTLFRL
jgi:hypothetical protein